MSLAFVSSIRFRSGRACWPLLGLVLGLAVVACSAQVPSTNPPSRGPSLAEVRKKWGEVPLAEVRRAAEGGDPTAQHYLGFCYREGLGVAADAKESVKWYRLAAAQGHTIAMVNVGRAYRFGRGVGRDSAEAIRWFRLASERGDPLGTVNLGWVYEAEADAPQYEKIAMQLYLEAAEKGQPEAMFELYLCYVKGRNVPEDRSEAVKWLAKGAEAGYAAAQCEFGYRCENPPNGEPANMPEALRWYRLAAGQGNAWAQFNLGRCYLEGKGVGWNEEQALGLMRAAADQDHAEALFDLADLYARGIGEPRSATDQPMQLLQRAALNGCNLAYEVIVRRYQFGVGGERDLVAAAEWYYRAAVAGVVRFSLEDNRKPKGPGFCFQGLSERSGFMIRLPYDEVAESPPLREALALYKAASRNDSRALLELGQKYLGGSDAPKSPRKAWLWFTLAARNGAAEARAKLSGIEAEMAASELAEAKRLLPGLVQELKQVAAALPQPARTGEGP